MKYSKIIADTYIFPVLIFDFKNSPPSQGGVAESRGLPAVALVKAGW
jgi:hypothetical protein